MPAFSCATRTVSCAVATSKKAAITVERRSARAAPRSVCAMSRASPAALTRAPRLPPVSIGAFNVVVVVRLAFCLSSMLK